MAKNPFAPQRSRKQSVAIRLNEARRQGALGAFGPPAGPTIPTPKTYQRPPSLTSRRKRS